MTTRATVPADGITSTFTIPFNYLDRTHVKVMVDGVAVASTGFSFVTDGTIQITPAPSFGSDVTIYRETPSTPLTTYQSGSVLTRDQLEVDSLQALYRTEEAEELSLRLPADTAASTLLPALTPLAPLVVNGDGTGFEMGSSELTGDMLMRSNLADVGDGKGAEMVGFDDAAAPAYLKTVSDILNGVPVSILRNIPRSRWAGIQARTDTEDCAAAIMDLMDGAYAARQVVLRVPNGTFTIHQPIQRLAGTAPFRLIGDDWRRSIITRGSDWAASVGAGSVFNITGVDSHSIENLRIIGNNTLYPLNGNHAIACSNSNHVTYRKLYIEDWKNSGILVFHHPGSPAPDTPQEQNNVIESCYLDGKSMANNGILFVDQFYSYIRGCTVRDLGNTGTPQSALQFKNNCWQSHIHDCVAVNARHGIAFGQESVDGIAAEQCSATNVLVKDCVWGIYMGSTAYSTLDNINIDMGGVGSHGIEMIDCVDNALTNIKLRKQRVGGSNPYSVKMTNASSGNLIHFSQLDIDESIPEIAWFGPSATNNVVVVDQLKTPSPLSYSGQGCLNENPSATGGNALEIKGLAVQEALTITAGVATLKNPRATLVRVDTEAGAATDDLDTIEGPGVEGQTIVVKSSTNARDITVKHGTGNIRLAGGVDFTLSLVQSRITLQWNAGINYWCEVARSANA